MKGIFIDISKCTACKSCEIACAVAHSKSGNLFEAIFEKPAPRKRVYVEPANSHSYPSRCMHCKDAPCVIACPNGAMKRDEQRGIVLVNEDRCMGCLMCAMVCPFGAITLDSEKGKAVKCDFCTRRLSEGKVPACVEACPTSSLRFGELEEMVKEKRRTIGASVVVAAETAKENL
ncbi:MAG: 4Fe-4S dicluster domain-containing protein [Nitrospirae bacterium]|nr:4Fe-4S dicluster domain-containing protein [Nitrospirota bacterium]